MDATGITVENSYGNTLYVSRDILENMHSGDHYDREVNMNMTALAELLQSVQDHVFTVQFKKQATEDRAKELLSSYNSKNSKIPDLVKSLVNGESCTMTCHMVEVENNLGRSLVIDLGAKTDSKFRQIDHRTIEWVIFQNVKYNLQRGGMKYEDAMESAKKSKGDPNWNSSKLSVGNWFSGTNYYKAQTINKDSVVCTSKGMNIEISRDILEYEMHNSDVFTKEE